MFKAIAPIIPVRDLDAALARYDRLGFETHAYRGEDRYGFANRDEVSLHLSESREHDPSRTDAAVYLDVADADAVYREWSAADVEGRLTEPRDMEWGTREFSYVDPDGTLHRVGTPL